MMALLPLALPLALPPQEAVPVPAQDAEFFSMYVADAADMFRHPKDQALLAALRLVDDRLKELPGDIPDMPPLPPAVFDLATHLLVGEKTIHIGNLADAPAGSPFPLYVQLAMKEGDAERAADMHQSIRDLVAGFGVELPPAENGMTPIPVPAPVEVLFGQQGGDFVVTAGKTEIRPIGLEGTGLPPGVAPSLLMHIDYAHFLDLMFSGMAMEAPNQAEEMRNMMSLLGVDDLVFDMAAGSNADNTFTMLTMPGYGKVMRETGVAPERTLTAADLALVPRDATWASVGAFNLRGTIESILTGLGPMLEGQGIGDPVEMLQGMTGFHLYEDIVDNFGSTWGLYASDTTGGGGLLSIVAFVELSDAQRLRQTQERVTDMIDGLGEMEAEGYVRVRDWEHGGAQLASLTFPGLPVPFEPTIVTTATHLFISATPQGAVAAVEQASGRNGSLVERPDFQAQLPGRVEGAYAVSFMDSKRLIRDGYGMTSLLCSALVNGTRSRMNLERDAGVILPSYHELAAGAKATVSLARVVGDDYVQVTQSDPSVLVNVASFAGLVGSSPMLALVPLVFFGVREEMQTAAIPMEYALEPIPDETPADQDD
ncbi:MAG: hypothetical protein GY711_08725 [bacterium]|nr:hypothetical protein [bacterium]